MDFCQEPSIRGDMPTYAALTLHTQGWFCIRRLWINKTLANLLRYKSSCLSLKPSPTYFQPREHFFKVSQWKNILLLMSPLGLESLVLISRILLLPMAFLASSFTIKLRWMSLFFMLQPTIGFLLGMYCTSTEYNNAPLLRNLLPS